MPKKPPKFQKWIDRSVIEDLIVEALHFAELRATEKRKRDLWLLFLEEAPRRFEIIADYLAHNK